MSTRTVGLIFIFYTISSVIWFVFFAFVLNNGMYDPFGQILHIVLLVLLFSVVFVHYSKKVKLVEIKHQLYQSLYESDQNLIFLLDQNGYFMRANDTVLKTIGFDKEQVLGKHYSHYIKQELLEDVNNCFQEALQGKMTKSSLEFFTKEEKNFCAEVRFNPIAVKGKVGSVLVALKDVTEKTEVKKTLQETQRNMKLITENASEMIAVLDEQARLIFTTPSFEHVFGEKPDTYYGRNAMEALKQPEIVEDVYKRYTQCLEKNEMFYHSFVREDDTGVLLYFEAVGTPVVEENGEINQMVCVVRDVTERKEQEILLYRTERLHMLGEMAAGIAHEIKNPLASVRGFVQLFQSKDNEEQHKPYYKLVLDELDRVNEIVNDFLTFAKPKEPKKILLNMEQTVEDVKKLMNSEAGLHSVTIHHGKREQEAFVNGDESQLKQVLINVVKNAIEASKAGDRILIESETREACYFLRVTDEGYGIEEERIVRLGEAFHTSKEGGTGLGLMVSKRILAEHGGSIDFKSTLEKGTTVEITLPYVPKSLV